MDVYRDTYSKLESGEYCLQGMCKVILGGGASDEARLAYAVVTAWLKLNEPEKLPAVLAILDPFMAPKSEKSEKSEKSD